MTRTAVILARLDERRHPLAVLAYALVSALALALYLTLPPSPDQRLFDVIAYVSLEGGAIYADAFEINWPGKPLLHQLGQAVFGAHEWTWRATDFLILQLGVLGGVLFLRRSGMERAGIAFALLYPLLYVTAGSWMAGQRDILAGGLLVLASALTLPRRDGTARLAEVAAVGALAAFCVTVRPTLLAFAAGLVVVEFLPLAGERGERRWARVVALAAGAGAVVLAFAAAMLALGNLDDWWAQAVRFPLTIYQEPRSRLNLLSPTALVLVGSWHWLTVLGTAGLAAWTATGGVGDRRPARSLMLLVGLAGSVFLGFAAMNKGFGYHLGGLLIVLTLLTVVLLSRLARWTAGGQRWAGAALALCGLIVIAGTAKKVGSGIPRVIAAIGTGEVPYERETRNRLDTAERADAVRRLREGTAPAERVLQWGLDYDLPALAGRPPATRLVNTPILDHLNAAVPAHRPWLEELAASLDARPPEMVVVATGDTAGAVRLPFPVTADTSAADRIVLERLNEDYEVVRAYRHAVLLRRRDER